VTPFRKRSKAGILLELFLDSFLLLLFALQVFVLGCLLAYGYIPVPTSWANQQLMKYLPEGFRIEAEIIRLKLNGEVELSNLNAWVETLDQPILSAGGAVVKLEMSGDGWLPSLDDVVISGGTLYLPAVYSPDGLRRSILEKTAFRLIPDSESVRIDSFAAIHDTIRLRGAVEWPIDKQKAGADVAFSERLKSFYQFMANGIKGKERFEIFTTPTLLFHLSANEDRSVKLVTTVASPALNFEQAVGENFRAQAEFKIKDKKIEAESVFHLSAEKLELSKYEISVCDFDAIIQKEQWGSILAATLPNLELYARELHVFDIVFDAPLLDVQTEDFPIVSFSGATDGLNGAVKLTGEVHTVDQSAHVHAVGSVDLVSLLPGDLVEKFPILDFAKAPFYDLRLSFGEGFSLDAATLGVDAYGVSANGITFDHINANASFEEGTFVLDDVYISRDWQWLNLTFSLNTNSWDYKVSLLGSANPNDYNPILPRWWGGIFRSFDFSQVGDNLGDFIIYGNAKKPVADLFYGHAYAENASFMDVLVEQASLVVRGRGMYSEVIDIDAKSDGGWAKGSISFSSKEDDVRAPMAIRLNFDSQLCLEDTEKLFGKNIQAILNDFETEAMPRVSLSGVIFHKAYPQYAGRSYFDLTASHQEPISYKQVPLDALSFSLFARSDVTHLRNLEFGYADGKGVGSIDILTPKDGKPSIRYDVSLSDANQGQAISGLPQLDDVEIDLTDEVFTKEYSEGREQGRLDLALNGAGPVEDPLCHSGYGYFEIRNDQLGAVQLFGPLSRLLKDTPFSFTSFNLNTMTADFELKDGLLSFDPLRIDGPRTCILAPGTMKLDDQGLDMRVSVNLFANLGSEDSALNKVGNLITKPIPNLLVFDLTGTIKEQKWRSVYDPRKLIPTF